MCKTNKKRRWTCWWTQIFKHNVHETTLGETTNRHNHSKHNESQNQEATFWILNKKISWRARRGAVTLGRDAQARRGAVTLDRDAAPFTLEQDGPQSRSIVTPRRHDRDGAASRSSVTAARLARAWTARRHDRAWLRPVLLERHVRAWLRLVLLFKRSFCWEFKRWLLDFGFHCVCCDYVDLLFHQVLFHAHCV